MNQKDKELLKDTYEQRLKELGNLDEKEIQVLRRMIKKLNRR